MPQDKYKATWVSNSSISDFLTCPRLYYLRNVYKDPQSNHKINIINPSLALGQTVHEVLESLSFLNTEDRFKISLIDNYNDSWKKVSGKLGGFKNADEEQEIKERGIKMLQLVLDNPGPLLNKAIKIKKHDPTYLPNYYLSEDENIILCGKIDWLEYIPTDSSVHIIDFKTGKRDESPNSLQLPIYYLLAKNCQELKVSKASYWYLDRNNKPTEVSLPNTDDAYNIILEIARRIKQLRLRGEYLCVKNGCFACEPFEAIIKGKAEFVGVGGYNQDLYIIS